MKLPITILILISCSFALVQATVGFTGSMYPTFKGGEKILMIETNTADTGDIVAFKKQDKLVMHRVMFKILDCYVTKGDAAILPDVGCQKIEYRLMKWERKRKIEYV